MPATVIFGGHWGDEGKGKVIDLVAGRFQYNVRYSGGANAGHTVVNDRGTFALHQVPSGVFHPQVAAMLSSGVVVEPGALLQEMSELQRRGIDLTRFYVSERAHLVMPYHRALDAAQEVKRGDARLGTTGKGIGPAYTDKAARQGLRAGDLLDSDELYRRVRLAVDSANEALVGKYRVTALPAGDIAEAICRSASLLRPLICDVERELGEALALGHDILLEGAQGALLDVDMGSYPFVTSSSTGVAGACASAGLPPCAVTSVIAVLHAYMTRVGAGPFPTELEDETAEHIRTHGNEFGTTTGRPRRCGWFDAVASRCVMRMNGVTSVALTKLDVLDALDPVRICVGYSLDGKLIDYVPSRSSMLARCEPVYEELPGWNASTRDARGWSDLPSAAKKYILRIEELMHAPVSIVSVGPARQQTIVVRDPLLAG